MNTTLFAWGVRGCGVGVGDAKDSGIRKLLTFLRILIIWCSQKRLFELQDLCLEGSLLKNFEEGGVLSVNHGTSDEKAVGLTVRHRREKLFDRYFSRTILLVNAVTSGCRNAVRA
jgi:hypothetical protein